MFPRRLPNFQALPRAFFKTPIEYEDDYRKERPRASLLF